MFQQMKTNQVTKTVLGFMVMAMPCLCLCLCLTTLSKAAAQESTPETAPKSQVIVQTTIAKPKKAKKPEFAKSPIRKMIPKSDKKFDALDHLFVPIHWGNPATGLAIGGYDPIAFFEHKTAIKGEEEFEVSWRGTSWRFISEGNLKAFKRSPSIYVPAYAGYDAYALSKGILAEGLPSIWAIMNGRLYLFHTPVNRYLWQERATKLKEKTRKNWTELSIDLPRIKIGK